MSHILTQRFPREIANLNLRKVRIARHDRAQRSDAPARGRSGEYFHVGVRPKADFAKFRTHDLGEPGHIQRVAGRAPSGTWSTVTWLISKHDAHVEGRKLVPDTAAARAVLEALASAPVHVAGDRFEVRAKPAKRAKARPGASGKAKARGGKARKPKARKRGRSGTSQRRSKASRARAPQS